MNILSNPEEAKERYDVVVVGAGPAGCTAARLLSKKYDVLLVERSVIPRTKPCGGMLVEETQAFIEKLDPPSHVFSDPKYIDVIYADLDNGVEARAGRRFGNVFREAFDYWLFRLLEKKDVDVLYLTAFNDFRVGEEVSVQLVSGKRTRELKVRYIVDGGGASSLIRRKLYRPAPTYSAVQKYCTTSIDGKDYAYFIFDSSITDWYAWVIPKQLYTVLGFATKKGGAKFDEFMRKVGRFVEVGNCFEIEGHPLTRIERREDIFLGNERIFLIGEAAGFVSPSFGEGISFALRSASALSEALVSESRPREEYERLARPLMDEMMEKLEKAKKLSDPTARARMSGK